MTAEEQQLRDLFAQLARRQVPRGTDGGLLRALKRRRRTRIATATLAVLVLVAGGVVAAELPGGSGGQMVTADPTASPTATEMPTQTATASRPPLPAFPVPPTLTAKTGTLLVVVQETRLELLDVDTGKRTLLTTDRRLLGNDRIDVLGVGGQLVMLADNQTGAGNGPNEVLATTAGPGSPLRVIGQASYLRSSSSPGRLWLVSVLDTNNPMEKLVEVDLHGGVHQAVTFRDVLNTEPFARGFLRETVMPDGSSGHATELVDARNRLLKSYLGSVVAVQGDTAVLADRSCPRDCTATVLSARGSLIARRERSTALDLSSESTLSPDGARLLIDEPDGRVSATHLTALMLSGGGYQSIDDAWGARYYGPSVRFSPDGRWMFFIDADEKSIDAHDLTTHRSYRVPGRFRTITQLEPLS